MKPATFGINHESHENSYVKPMHVNHIQNMIKQASLIWVNLWIKSSLFLPEPSVKKSDEKMAQHVAEVTANSGYLCLVPS